MYFNDFKPYNDRLGEECGIFGMYGKDGNLADFLYYALYALQHRGQQSAGIAVSNGRSIKYYKNTGLVSEVFHPEELKSLGNGHIALGHVRYSSFSRHNPVNAQPLVVNYKFGEIALANNGKIVNRKELRKQLENGGSIFQTDMSSEIFAHVIAKYNEGNIVTAIQRSMEVIQGAYSFIVMDNKRLIGVRDPRGFRPLCIGKYNDTYILSSETCALDAIGAQFVRDVEPGEIVYIDENGLQSIPCGIKAEKSLCVFEYVYFARTDSVIDSISVYHARKEMGRRLAKSAPVDADMVIGVPDSALAAAMGYAEESGIPYGDGLTKNRYIGRTFIQPKQSIREESVGIKLNALRENITGKRLVLVDDSIVRGTTSKRIVELLRRAGAKEVHMRISSPPVKFPCHFGIDTASPKELIGSNHNVDEICSIIGADSLGYLRIEDMLGAVETPGCGYCASCFDGKYPIHIKG